MEINPSFDAEASKQSVGSKNISGLNFKTMTLLRKQENLLSEFETNLQKTINSLTNSKSISPSLTSSAHKSPSSMKKMNEKSVGIRIAEDEEVNEVRPFSNNKKFRAALVNKYSVQEVSDSSLEEEEDRNPTENPGKEGRKYVQPNEYFNEKVNPEMDRLHEQNRILNEKCLSLQSIIKASSDELKKEYEHKLARAERTFKEIELKEREYIEQIKSFVEREQQFKKEKKSLEERANELEKTLKKREDEFLQYGEDLMKDFQTKTISQLQKEREKYEREINLLHQELAKEKMEKHTQIESYQTKNLKLYNLVLELEKEKGNLLCGRTCICDTIKTGGHSALKSEHTRDSGARRKNSDEPKIANIFTNEKITKNIANQSLTNEISFHVSEQEIKSNCCGGEAANKILEDINIDLNVGKRKHGAGSKTRSIGDRESFNSKTGKENFSLEINRDDLKKGEKLFHIQEESVYENMRCKFDHSLSDPHFALDHRMPGKNYPGLVEKDPTGKSRFSNKENINPSKGLRDNKNQSMIKLETTPSKRSPQPSSGSKKAHRSNNSLKSASTPKLTVREINSREQNKKKHPKVKENKDRQTANSNKGSKIPVYSKI